MGIKFLSLRVIPWCFHLIGSRLSCLQLSPEEEAEPPVSGTVKLIKSDGVVKIYNRPVPVSDLMVEFPKHLVCSSDSFYIGQKIPALSEHDHLQIGHKYFLLPRQFFQTTLSFVTVASFAASAVPEMAAARNAFVKTAATCPPFDIQKTPSGCLRIRVSDEFIAQLVEERKAGEAEEEEEERSLIGNGVCTTAQLQKDYARLVGYSTRQWKPKLETIRETSEKKRRRIGAPFRRKSKVHHNHGHVHHKSSSSTAHDQHQHHAHVTNCAKPCSKSKVKTKSRK